MAIDEATLLEMESSEHKRIEDTFHPWNRDYVAAHSPVLRLLAAYREQAAQLADCRAALADVVAVLADYRAAGVAFDDVRLDYVDVQIPRDVMSDAEAVLDRAAALLDRDGKEA